MIKCNVTACGIIVSSAVEKQNKEGGKFLAFTLVVPIEGKDKSVKELHIGVTTEGDQTTAANYSAGRRVTIKGNLYIRKVEEAVYYNLRSEGAIEQNESSAQDRLEGSMEFEVRLVQRVLNARQARRVLLSRYSLPSLQIKMEKSVPLPGLASWSIHRLNVL